MKLLLGWRLITLALVLPMFGCASSGIVQTGQNSYMLAKSEWGFTSGAVHIARLMQDATEFCKVKGKYANLVSSNSNDVQFGKTPAAEIRFQCVDSPTSNLQTPSTSSQQTIAPQKPLIANSQVNYGKVLNAHAWLLVTHHMGVVLN